MTEISPIRRMLETYRCRTTEERIAALREIVQELALIGLSRTDFFSRAAFYGGTALRIFHGLDRFSEDLDFSLDRADQEFSLDRYLPAVEDELLSWGFELKAERKEKKSEGAVQSAFIKGGTLTQLIRIAAIDPPVSGVSPQDVMRVKVEIDTDPPGGAGYETKYRLNPIPFAVRLYDRPSLFAGKTHALLCRKWKDRVKGRDFYDYLWYLAAGIPLNIAHLESRMRQSGHWDGGTLTRDLLAALLEERFRSVDIERARSDALPFLRDTRAVEFWSTEMFISVTREKLSVV